MKRKTAARGVQRLDERRFRIRAYVTDPMTGRAHEIDRIVEASSVPEAIELRATLRREYLETRDQPALGRVRLGTFAASWLRSKLPTLKRSTRKAYAEVLDAWILPTLGDVYLDGLTLDAFTAWRDAMGGAPESVNNRVRVLRTVLRAARRMHPVAVDPDALTGVRAPVTEDDDEEHGRGLAADELRAVLVALHRRHRVALAMKYPTGLRWYPFVATLALTGARFGEIAALRWTDIDEARGVIRIRRAAWKGQIDAPKSKAGKRDVPLVPMLAAILAEHRRAMVATQAPGLASGLVFPSNEGTPSFNSVLTKPVRAALLEAGVTRPFRAAHGFRHTFNNLVRQVASGVVVRALVGHTDEAMTDRYSAVAMGERHAAVASVVRMVDPGTEPGIQPGIAKLAPDAGSEPASQSAEDHGPFGGAGYRIRTDDLQLGKQDARDNRRTNHLEYQRDPDSLRFVVSPSVGTKPGRQPGIDVLPMQRLARAIGGVNP